METLDEDNSAITLGVFAHANAGKTTLTEHILFHTHSIETIGRIDDGTTFTDSLSVEKQRGITVRAAMVTFNIDGRKVQLIDTPGHIDFSAEVERALQVLDCAVVVISGVEKVEPQTYTLWRLLKQKKVPTIIFINKMDRAGADYKKTLDDIKKKLEQRVISLIAIPDDIEQEQRFIPKGLPHLQIAEQLAEIDDEMFELFLDDPGQISEETVKNKLRDLIGKAEVSPVVGGSALKNEGVEHLIQGLIDYLPSSKGDKDGKFSAFVYMVRVNEGKKDYYTKILSGKVQSRVRVLVGEEQQQIKGLQLIEGGGAVAVEEAKAGDIVIVRGIDTSSGNYLGVVPENITQVKFVNPLIAMNVAARDKEQTHDLVKALAILNEEDSYLNVSHDNDSGLESVTLMGEIQAQILQTMLQERFGIDTDLSNPILIHKETPTKKGVGVATYTKVSAVKLEVTPLPPGTGVVFKSKLSTDYLLKKYQRQAERLVKQYARQGMFGWEVTDAEIALVDGRFDSMGSELFHFNIAVPLALMRALRESNMSVLEPISSFTLVFPKDFLSEVVKTLSGFEGTFEIVEDNSDEITIQGEAKHRNLLNFSQTLLGLTGGRGTYASFLSRYEPSQNQDITKAYHGPDPRNETVFVINDMAGSLDALDQPFTKKKKESSSKFKRQQKEKMFSKKGKR